MNPWAIVWFLGAASVIGFCLWKGAIEFLIGALIVLGLFAIGAISELMERPKK